ncbi:MAG: hypothetical protein H6993_11675 [Pseudomonadales bacterium]|nr:hypothetical protein [Pseudomonadales bacterium]MCP5184615.1 hypothetical protein [Pseudomonadales bacterium]
MHRRLSVLIVVMAVIHGIALWRWPLPVIVGAPAPVPTPEFSIEMRTPDEVAPAIPPSARTATVRPTPPGNRLPAIRQESTSAPGVPPPVAGESASLPAAQLDLTPPAYPVAPEREVVPGLEFRPTLKEAIGRRRTTRERQALLAQARVARLGLDAETFNSVDQHNGHIKTARGCFDVRPDFAGGMARLSEGNRYWMTSCREVQRGSMKLFSDLPARVP